MAQLAQFSLSFACEAGDVIDVWGHSPGVTTEDYEKDPSIDPYYIHDTYTISDTEPPWYWFLYDETRGYVAAILVNGVEVARREIEPVVIPELPDPSIHSVLTNYTSIQINFINVESSDTISVGVVINGTTYTYTPERHPGNTAIIYFSGIPSGTTLLFKITINGKTTDEYYSTDSYPVFQWDTTIASGAAMVVNGNEVSPITATEWNRFLDIYNLKKGSSYSHVSKGDEFSVKSGSVPKTIADSLGVSVSVGNTITAKFFNDLKNALNALG